MLARTTPLSPDRLRWRDWVIACAVYAALTVAITWPVAVHLRSALPHDPYDPVLNTWILWWDAHAVPLSSRWWSAPLFSPMPGALALSELLLGISLLTTPLQWLGVGAVTSYNIAFLAAFMLTALAAHALVFALTRRHDAGYIAGCAVSFNAYRIAHAAHVQVLWMFGVPLALLALHRYLATQRPAWLMAFASAFLVQALSNGYLLLMFPVLVLLFIAWFCRTRKAAAAVAAATALTLASLAPIAWGYYHWQNDLSLERTLEEIDAFSADATALIAAGPATRLWAPLSRFERAEDEFFPGALVALLVAVGGVAALRRDSQARPRPRSVRLVRTFCVTAAGIAAGAVVVWALVGPWTFPPNAASPLLSVRSPQKPATVALMLALVYALSSRRLMAARDRGSVFVFYLLAAVAMFLFALGPNPRFNGTPIMFHGPYWWLLQLPGFSGLRVPARFGALFAFCVATAAALAFAQLTAKMTDRRRALLAVAASIVILAEAWPRMTVAPLPPARPIAGDGAGALLLELPAGTVEGDTAALFRSMSHRLPLVNGYSGYLPIHYSILRRALELGDERVLDVLCRDRDLLVAVEAGGERWSPLVMRHPRAALVAAEPPWHLYRITRAPDVHDGSIGERLAVASIAASGQQADVGRMLDTKLDTWWSSGRPQHGDEELTVDLRDESDVTAVRLELGRLPMAYPRDVRVDCAGSDHAWQPCWTGSSSAAALSAALQDPRTMPITLFIRRGAVRRLRLRQLGVDPLDAWSIAELSVYGTRATVRP